MLWPCSMIYVYACVKLLSLSAPDVLRFVASQARAAPSWFVFVTVENMYLMRVSVEIDKPSSPQPYTIRSCMHDVCGVLVHTPIFVQPCGFAVCSH